MEWAPHTWTHLLIHAERHMRPIWILTGGNIRREVQTHTDMHL